MVAIFSSVITCLAALLLLWPTHIHAARWKGFSMGANHAETGACKTQADWEADFRTIVGWGKGFNAVRLYASSDCNTLANAVPAARNTKIKILVGVWATDGGHFGAEKAALLAALQTYGSGWIAAISVGSEDLYRSYNQKFEITPQQLANQIYDVRGMVDQWTQQNSQPKIQVGHTDTWTAWVDGRTDVVTRACDFVVTNGFPYWQGTKIEDAISYNVYQNSLWSTQAHVAAVKPGIKVWIGETGWPTQGKNFGAATTGRWNLERYYNRIGCWLNGKSDTNYFWFTAFDALKASDPVEQSFGIAYYNRKLKFTLKC
ncbi:hypothetical protein DRE_01240 [Drechslerella stenobrocha 248]|uniref:Probable glucan endo-1,3-beta-glucosidase eglC n=1 Tax=Drechslerella stenobrocha 248 TaxID=1043628 RepID=W7HMS6_9PEZI|nr:hypothetical protein DRE_01240 [Drechslerella stenobrocha 248]